MVCVQSYFLLTLFLFLFFQVSVNDRATGMSSTWDVVDKCEIESDCQVRPNGHTLNGSFTEITRRLPSPNVQPVNITATSAHVDDIGPVKL